MRRAILGLVVVALVGAGIAAFVWQQRGTPESRRADMVDRFKRVFHANFLMTNHLMVDGWLCLFGRNRSAARKRYRQFGLEGVGRRRSGIGFASRSISAMKRLSVGAKPRPNYAG